MYRAHLKSYVEKKYFQMGKTKSECEFYVDTDETGLTTDGYRRVSTTQLVGAVKRHINPSLLLMIRKSSLYLSKRKFASRHRLIDEDVCHL